MYHSHLTEPVKISSSAQAADEIFTGSAGDGLDFGQFCSADSVLDTIALFQESDGIAIAATDAGDQDGTGALTACDDAGSSLTATSVQNVIRVEQDLAIDSAINDGQINISDDDLTIINCRLIIRTSC